MGSESDHQHNTVFSPSFIDETSLSLPTLPFDLIPEILSRLPVKLLVQFRCVCKSWNSLISDSKFSEKHLRFSTKNLVHILTYPYILPRPMYVLKSCPFDLVFTDVATNHIVQFEIPSKHFVYFVGSCNGILCLANGGFVTIRLWNPSIRKFKEMPSIGKQQNFNYLLKMYGFGYDAVSNDYKVVYVFHVRDDFGNNLYKQEVKVQSLGTNFWKSIQKFPFCYASQQPSGKFMRDTISWLVSVEKNCFIVSLDLGNESCKEILLPDDYGAVNAYIGLHLGVLRDCLCLACGHDVWVLKEHGNKDSWTKLFTISYMRDFPTSHATIEVLHIFEDGQVLLKSKEGWTWKLISYNSRNGTFKFTEFKFVSTLEVCVESLISPCS